MPHLKNDYRHIFNFDTIVDTLVINPVWIYGALFHIFEKLTFKGSEGHHHIYTYDKYHRCNRKLNGGKYKTRILPQMIRLQYIKHLKKKDSWF